MRELSDAGPNALEVDRSSKRDSIFILNKRKAREKSSVLFPQRNAVPPQAIWGANRNLYLFILKLYVSPNFYHLVSYRPLHSQCWKRLLFPVAILLSAGLDVTVIE